jgi:hypothetical protein
VARLFLADVFGFQHSLGSGAVAENTQKWQYRISCFRCQKTLKGQLPYVAYSFKGGGGGVDEDALENVKKKIYYKTERQDGD